MKHFAWMAVALLCGCGGETPPRPSAAHAARAAESEANTTEATITIDTGSMCSAFETDTGTYLIGRSVVLDGIVSRVEKDKEGDAYVRFVTKPEWEIRAYTTSAAELRGFVRGSRVVANGVLKERAGSSINLADCHIERAEVDAKSHWRSTIGLSTAEAAAIAEDGPYTFDTFQLKVHRLHGKVMEVAADDLTVELEAPDGWRMKCYPERGQKPPRPGSILVVAGEFHYSQFSKGFSGKRPLYLQLKQCSYIIED